MNWGYKIVFAFVVFVGIMVYMVVRCFQQDINLVADDYYKRELNYQQQIDKIANASDIEFDIEMLERQLVINFPDNGSKLSGNIQLFRPSNKLFDKNYPVTTDSNNRQIINTQDLLKGYYKLKVDWSDGITDYYKEESIFIN
ncbi:MAG TPA: FixH family protein [Cyclobacteriaceae bacterium]